MDVAKSSPSISLYLIRCHTTEGHIFFTGWKLGHKLVSKMFYPKDERPRLYQRIKGKRMFIDRVALAKQGDNGLGSVRPSVRPSVNTHFWLIDKLWLIFAIFDLYLIQFSISRVDAVDRLLILYAAWYALQNISTPEPLSLTMSGHDLFIALVPWSLNLKSFLKSDASRGIMRLPVHSTPKRKQVMFWSGGML